jgi:phthalate 4,5-dioxygenase oxygenase subunit
MLSREVKERLTRIGPDIPAGKLLRRYWHPACLASELTDETPKKRIRIMDEELVVFRLPAWEGDSQVRYGC